jgi:hypothetical protein
LRVVGLEQTADFTNYHRVLNRNRWSSRWVARCLVRVLVNSFVPSGPVVIGLAGGHRVVGADVGRAHRRSLPDRRRTARPELEGEGAGGATSIADFCGKLTKPRAVWIMVPAAFTQQTGKAEEYDALMKRLRKTVRLHPPYTRDEMNER